MAKGLLTDEDELRKFNAIEAQAQPWYAKALPMEGRATFLPFRDSMPGSVFNKRELAVPGLIAEAANAITAPARSLLGTDPEFEAGKEGVNMALNVIGGGVGSSAAMRNPTGQGGVDLAMGVDIKPEKRNSFEIFKTDASDIYGKGSERIKYTDPNSGGYIDILAKSDGTASVVSLEVPKEFRGSGVGKSLQDQAMIDFPALQGQVSSKAAATNAYKLGRRPVGKPNATLDEVLRMIDEDSSVNLVTGKMQGLLGN